MWDLVQRLTGQIRAVPGAVLGWDMTAALAMAEALGIERRLAAEWLPAIETEMVRGVNGRISQGGRDG